MGAIGFFDSGVGGLTVLAKAIQVLPSEDYIYYADTAHVPYGEKSKEMILKYVKDAVAYLSTLDIKALVVACNTATATAINDLRAQYHFPVIGMEPAVKPALHSLDPSHKRILVMATRLTLNQEKFKALVDRYDTAHLIDAIALPDLVMMAEAGNFNIPQCRHSIQTAMGNLEATEYGTVVLGCTHFPFFRPVIQTLFPEGTPIIDGHNGTVLNLYNQLASNNLLAKGNGTVQFYESGNLVTNQSRLHHFQSLLDLARKIQ
jgi:glutamate racemase